MQKGLSSRNFLIFIYVFSIYFSCKSSWSNPCRNSPDDNQQVLWLGRCFCCPWTGFFVLLLFVDWSTKCQQAHDWSIKVWINIVHKLRNTVWTTQPLTLICSLLESRLEIFKSDFQACQFYYSSPHLDLCQPTQLESPNDKWTFHFPSFYILT